MIHGALKGEVTAEDALAAAVARMDQHNPALNAVITPMVEQAEADASQTALRRFLGVDGGLGSKLGLPDDFVVQVIRSTGNYGEMYDRHLGPSTPVAIPRGANRLAEDGGVMIAPPFT